MNRHVEINVTGIHSRQGEPTEKVESTTTGTYELLEDGSRVVEYDEDQGTGSKHLKVHNRVRIGPDGRKMEILRAGANRSVLKFGEKMEYDTEYNTPYGSMQMKVRTNSFDLNMHGEDEMRVIAEYDLEIEGQVLSRSMIVLDIKNAVAN
jgi:uncharacterized beta-barrel protein YwiB (DUF1934 family)